MLIRLLRNNRGDTIVEVLIAIAVASAALGTAYAIVNRTSRSQQQSVERTEALKIAESQIEALRITGASSFGTNTCFKNNVPVSGAASCAQGRYNILVTNQGNNIFKTQVSWPSLSSGGNDTVSLFYKVYQ